MDPEQAASEPFAMLLIVDDDPAFLESVKMLFGSDWQVFFAQNGTQALQLAADLDFSVVLIDLVLGRENGFELISEFHRRFPRLPVVAMSGTVNQQFLKNAIAFGAVDTLSKPATPYWKVLVSRLSAPSDRISAVRREALRPEVSQRSHGKKAAG